jgi:hypothetical protein
MLFSMKFSIISNSTTVLSVSPGTNANPSLDVSDTLQVFESTILGFKITRIKLPHTRVLNPLSCLGNHISSATQLFDIFQIGMGRLTMFVRLGCPIDQLWDKASHSGLPTD